MTDHRPNDARPKSSPFEAGIEGGGGEWQDRGGSPTRGFPWVNGRVLALIVLGCVLIVWFDPFHILRPAGGKLSQLDLQPLTGTEQSVTLADLTGQVVLLNFWGTWCPPCRRELPHIADLYQEFGGQTAFRLLAVSCGSGGPEDLAALRTDTSDLLDQANISMPTYADPDRISRQEVERVVGFEGYPTTLLIDRRGDIRRVWTGFVPGNEVEMREMIAQLLAEG